jgi:hypothetical protein
MSRTVMTESTFESSETFKLQMVYRSILWS